MHEYSIVQSLIKSCEEQAEKNSATKITKVVLKVGVLSGVEIELLKTAFDTFKEETICDSCEILINYQKIVILCNKCKEESTLEKNEFLCPSCDSNDLEVVDGEDMYLMSLEME